MKRKENRNHRQCGALILEVVIALGIMGVVIPGFFALLRVGLAASASVADTDHARVAIENVAELLRRSRFE